MSGIYGIFRFDGAPVEAETLQVMRQAMAYYGPDGGGEWRDGPVGFGQLQLRVTPEDRFETQPLTVDGMTLVAAARLDNRDELLKEFQIAVTDRPTTPDSRLVLEAYRRWGEDCPDGLNGDWQFAVWDSRRRTLFIARDHHGNTGLYYYCDSHFLAFASSLKGLLALPDVPRSPDLVRIAYALVSSPDDGVRTGYEGLLRLPPAHVLRVTETGAAKRRYWFPENLPTLYLPDDRDYAEQFLEIYRQAVRVRLRSEQPVGVALSGGLDSGSVATLASPLLAAEGKKLTAFTAVPLFAPTGAGRNQIGDEWPLAEVIARQAGNIVHVPVRSEGVSILAAIERFLELKGEAGNAPSNYYWLLDIMERARGRGIGTLLTGQGGNATVSYDGSGELFRPLRRGDFRQVAGMLRLSEPDFWLTLKRQIVKPVLLHIIRLFRSCLRPRNLDWLGDSAINPEFAREIRLAERMRHDGYDDDSIVSCRLGMHLSLLKLGAETVGSFWHEMGAWYGLDIRDPTLDRRVIEFCLRTPDYLFRRHGTVRWLILQAMEGRMPGEALSNRKVGLQAADLGHRVQRERVAIMAALASLEGSATARMCLNLAGMKGVLASLEQEVTSSETGQCSGILLRGLENGLFLSRF